MSSDERGNRPFPSLNISAVRRYNRSASAMVLSAGRRTSTLESARQAESFPLLEYKRRPFTSSWNNPRCGTVCTEEDNPRVANRSSAANAAIALSPTKRSVKSKDALSQSAQEPSPQAETNAHNAPLGLFRRQYPQYMSTEKSLLAERVLLGKIKDILDEVSRAAAEAALASEISSVEDVVSEVNSVPTMESTARSSSQEVPSEDSDVEREKESLALFVRGKYGNRRMQYRPICDAVIRCVWDGSR